MTAPAPVPPAAAGLAPIVLPDPPVTSGGGGWHVHVYAHTHWDREWYRTFERFRMQLVGVVDRILDVLDADPRFTTFVLDGQTIVLEDYLVVRPEQADRIARLVAAGRLEVGPWFVLPDEFLVSGEALVRNLFEGRRTAARFGEPLAVGYLPDPFGHVAQLPQVLRGFGIDNAIFSRGMGDEFHRTGTEFRWVGPDGSHVLALVQTSPYTNGYCNAELFGRGMDAGDAEPWQAAADLAPYLAERARTDTMLFAAGCDHETVNAGLPDIIEGLRALLPGVHVHITGLAEYVEAAQVGEAALEVAGRPLERHGGELRGSLHSPILASIFSARIPLKQDNAELQALLERVVDPLVALAVGRGMLRAIDVQPFLRHAWRLVLKNQPHDSIGGCSVDEVHDEMPARSLRAREVCRGLIEDLQVAAGVQDVATVVDPSGRGGIARRRDGSLVWVPPLPALEIVPINSPALRVAGIEEVRVDDVGCSIENDGLRAAVEDGRLVVELAADGGGEPLRIEDAFGFLDEADAGDEYDWGLLAGDPDPRVARLVRWGARPAAPGIAELELVHHLDIPAGLDATRRGRVPAHGPHELVTTLRLVPGARHLDATTRGVNRSLDHRLRLRTAPVFDARDTLSDGHFLVQRRPVAPTPPGAGWKQHPPGIGCMESFAAVVTGPGGSDAGGGIALFGRGLHEFQTRAEESGDAVRLELTVLRAVGWLSRDDIEGRPGHAGPEIATPGGQCLGPFEVAWAFRPFASGEARRLAGEARAWAAAPVVLEPVHPDVLPQSGHLARAREVLAHLGGAPRTLSEFDGHGFAVEGDGVELSTVVLADDGSGDIVVRVFAPGADASRTATVRLAEPVRVAHLVRLDEAALEVVPWIDGACTFEVPVAGVVTVRLALGG